MADPTNSRRQMTASGLAGVLGLFAGLCAIFAGCVTVADWHVETAQARWPIVSALVERADVVVSARTPKDGGGTQTKLRYRVRYDVNGEQQSATLASRPAFQIRKRRNCSPGRRSTARVAISISNTIRLRRTQRTLLRPNYRPQRAEQAPT
jgi:hypothetical protein